MNFLARQLGIATVVTFAAFGCTAEPSETSVTNEIVSTPTVATDQTSYLPNAAITVTYAGMPGNDADWIAIAPAGAAPDTFGQWTYIHGQTSGSQVFAGLAVGSYEARAYVNDSYSIIATSTFSVAASTSAQIGPAAASYNAGQTITINYSNLPGNALDWIAISPAGSSDETFGQWFYLNGSQTGSQAFEGLSAGSYEARAYIDDSFTVIARGAVTVASAGAADVTTDSHSYQPNQAITVNFTGMPGASGDWVAIAAAGAPATSYLEWSYTGGTASGSHMFDGLPAGNYEARLFVNDDFTQVASVAFAVANPGATTTDMATYTTAETIVVTYSGLPGTSGDWVSIAVAGSADTSYVVYQYTGGTPSGTASFAGLPAGTYEARTYANDSFTVSSRSASFTVAP